MTLPLMVLLLAVALHHAARLWTARVGPVSQPRDVTAWHAAMALAMAGMVVAAMPGQVAWSWVVVFVAGTGWCLVEAFRRHAAAAHVRLAVGCAAMVGMLTLPVSASASSGAHGEHVASTGHGGHAAHLQGWPDLTAYVDTWSTSWPVAALLGVLVLGVLGVAVASTVRLLKKGRSGHHRMDCGCEVLMSAVAALMLVGMAA